MSRLRRLVCFSAPFWFGLVVAACGRPNASGDQPNDQPLLIMAAASLDDAMPAIIERYESRTGVQVDLATGATASLAAQLRNGAPANIFFAADETTVDRLAARGIIRPESVRVYATGELSVVWREGIRQPDSLRALVEDRFELIAIANPEIAPYGAAAKEALEAVAIWRLILPRIITAENVAQAYQLVQTGNADAAIIARSLAAGSSAPTLPVDTALHSPLSHAAGLLTENEHPAAAGFLEYVLEGEGRSILQAHGFGDHIGVRPAN